MIILITLINAHIHGNKWHCLRYYRNKMFTMVWYFGLYVKFYIKDPIFLFFISKKYIQYLKIRLMYIKRFIPEFVLLLVRFSKCKIRLYISLMQKCYLKIYKAWLEYFVWKFFTPIPNFLFGFELCYVSKYLKNNTGQILDAENLRSDSWF